MPAHCLRAFILPRIKAIPRGAGIGVNVLYFAALPQGFTSDGADIQWNP
jgi:hypothetical protein